jgi:superfamily I DNA/RNA helicase
VRSHLMAAMRRAWDDLRNPDGQLRYDHSAYLKVYALSRPALPVDFVFVDEGQDCNGVLLSILAAQDCQVITVGDTQQQINTWLGSVNALDQVVADYRAYLTRSFRFSEALADVANGLLTRLNAELRLTGGAPWTSTIGPIAEPDCVLTRTNAVAVRMVLENQERGRRVALMGGGKEVLSFARAAADLMDGQHVTHPELACFSDWGQVTDYVANDPAGSELRLLVNLVEDFKPATIVDALSRATSEDDADVVVSTCHKAKGREWDRVQIAYDFQAPKPMAGDLSDDELRLAYVAATRARRELDLTAVPHFLSGPLRLPESAPVVLLPS